MRKKIQEFWQKIKPDDRTPKLPENTGEIIEETANASAVTIAFGGALATALGVAFSPSLLVVGAALPFVGLSRKAIKSYFDRRNCQTRSPRITSGFDGGRFVCGAVWRRICEN